MTELADLLRTRVGTGDGANGTNGTGDADGTGGAEGAVRAPGAVALIARGDDVEVCVAGRRDLGPDAAPVTRDTIVRYASITKPITSAALLGLVDDGRLAPHDPIERWLPELAAVSVLRTPGSPVDDVVPLARPITVHDLLTSRAGWGFPSDFSLPGVAALFTVQPDGRKVQLPPPPDRWLAELATVPLLHQPGAAWLYNTCSDLQGVLISRVLDRPLPEVLAERVFAPLGMVDTGFVVPERDRGRFTSLCQIAGDGGLEVSDPREGAWSSLPAFPSGAGGLVGTVDDWFRFARMLLGDGELAGRRVLSPGSVRLMTTDHLTRAQRELGELFLEGQGWGAGGSVDVTARDPWNVPGRYGWVGGTGTSAHIVPATGTVGILLTQLAMTDPVAPALMREFWTLTARG